MTHLLHVYSTMHHSYTQARALWMRMRTWTRPRARGYLPACLPAGIKCGTYRTPELATGPSGPLEDGACNEEDDGRAYPCAEQPRRARDGGCQVPSSSPDAAYKETDICDRTCM